MRVLQLNIHYSGTGADRCARELYEYLPSLGVDSAMWVAERRLSDANDVIGLRSAWERVLFPLEVIPDLTDWRHRGSITALRNITEQNFDLVHIHIIHSGWISIRAVHDLTRRFPCVWTLHDEWAPTRGVTYDLTCKATAPEVKELSRGPIRYIPYDRYHDNFKWRRTRKYLDKWMPQPRVVICPSLYMANLAKSAGVFPRSEILHIPNGTRMPDVPNATMDRAEAKRSFGLSTNHPVVLMISADLAQAHKGIELGIRAIKGVDQQLGLQTLLLGRSGQLIAKALRPLSSVSVCALDDAALARAYRAADVTMIPSLGENFPYIGLESLACGTPLIAFPVGGLPEMIGRQERGLVCSSFDNAEMSQHLNYLIFNPSIRQEMGSRGTRWVRQTCDLGGYLVAVRRVYEGVLSSSPGRDVGCIVNPAPLHSRSDTRLLQ
jgi:glycosyltransferase involved in cell wall biosynthesis